MEKINDKYIGDEAFGIQLGNSRCKKSLDYIKGAILGAQTSSGQFGVEDVLKKCFSRFSYKRIDQKLLQEFLNLWKLLYEERRFPTSEHITPQFEIRSKKNFLDYAVRQIEAAEIFLEFFHMSNIEKYTKDPAFNRIYKAFFENVELLSSIRDSILNKWKKKELEDASRFLDRLQKFVAVMWDTKVSLKEYVKRRNIEKIYNKFLDGDNSTTQSSGSEFDCYCGSKKKYKDCCGRH